MKTDEELTRSYARSGDADAFTEIVDRHGSMVYRVCVRILKDRQEAEDATQTAFIVLARKARSVPASKLASWLHGVARRAALMARRSASRRGKHEEAAGMLVSDEANPTSAEHLAVLDSLDRELDKLSARERQAVVLRYLEGHSERDAAGIAGCPVGTLSRRASTGIARMRRRLSRRDVLMSVAGLIAVLETESRAALPEEIRLDLVTAPKRKNASDSNYPDAQRLISQLHWHRMRSLSAVAAVIVIAVAGIVAAQDFILSRNSSYTGDYAQSASAEHGSSRTGTKNSHTNAEKDNATVINPHDAETGPKKNLASKRSAQVQDSANGLRIKIVPAIQIVMKNGTYTFLSDHYSVERKGGEVLVSHDGTVEHRFQDTEVKAVHRTLDGSMLEWQNLNKVAIAVPRTRWWDRDFRLRITGADGSTVPTTAYARSKPPSQIDPLILKPGERVLEPFFWWLWFNEPGRSGEYSAQIEFEVRRADRDRFDVGASQGMKFESQSNTQPWVGQVSTERVAFHYQRRHGEGPVQLVTGFVDRLKTQDREACAGLLAPSASWQGKDGFLEYARIPERKANAKPEDGPRRVSGDFSGGHSWPPKETPAVLRAAITCKMEPGDLCFLARDLDPVQVDNVDSVRGMLFLLRRIGGKWKIVFGSGGHFPNEGLGLQGPPDWLGREAPKTEEDF